MEKEQVTETTEITEIKENKENKENKGKDQNITVAKAAGFLMLTMSASRILGYLRDVFIYHSFGQNRITDAYNAAFSIPDFLYMILVGGALSSSFIPVFSSYIAKDREEGWRVASIVLNWVMVLLMIGVAIGIAFTPQLVEILVPGFNPEAMELTVVLTKIMFAQVFFMSLSGISQGILQSYKHFTSPAIGSVLYNLGIIVGGLLLAAPIESRWPGYGIAGFSIGVVLGAMINFFVQVPALKKVGFHYFFSFDFRHPGVKKLMALMVPVFIGLSASEVNLFINQALASDLSPGMLAALKTGQRLMQLPIGIFAIAIAVAVFPTMTAHVARGEMDDFRKSASLGLRSVLFITIPAAVGLAVLRIPLVRFMYEFKTGAFTAASTIATADALFYYCIGLFAYGAIHVLSRMFYALQNTMTPVFASVVSIGVNIGLSLLFVGPMGHTGLALAYSLTGIFNMILLLVLLRAKTGSIEGGKLTVSFVKILLASAIMGAIVAFVAGGCEVLLGVDGKLVQVMQLVVSIAVGAVVYGIITVGLKMDEADMVKGILLRKLRRRRK